jgi:hyperosmotically inducible periplasmic protein
MTTYSFRKSTLRTALIAGSLLVGLSAGAYADPTDTSTPQPHSDGAGAVITDTAITAKVKSKFMGDDRLKNSDITVTTTNGIVTLTGSASGPDAKATAETLASGIDGVKNVDDNLQASAVAAAGPSKLDKAAAKTKRVASDSWITTKVKSEIAADSLSKGFDVSVTTTHGVVVLKGALASQGAIDHVKDLAEKVRGVKGVDTALLTVSTT